MVLIPILLVAGIAGFYIYREYFQIRAARRFVRIDYRSQGRRQGRR